MLSDQQQSMVYKLDLVAWCARGSCMFELQPARLGQRPTLVNSRGQSDSDTPATSL